jgi:hypothetical protein
MPCGGIQVFGGIQIQIFEIFSSSSIIDGIRLKHVS